MNDLFSSLETREKLADGAVLLRGFALAKDRNIISALEGVAGEAPFRHMTTPGGFRMSVAMTNCGKYGWVTDRRGYRYSPIDPETDRPWPPMPDALRSLAETAAQESGYAGFSPDACLINRYEPGAKMSLHQDKDEKDFTNPIVSVSLGIPATFQFGGLQRNDPVRKFVLHHGDVVVWGGPSRLFYHGILALKDGEHPQLGRYRYNLTFRKAQ
ncbi:DNA oxidative demethylase AlkB [Brucella grignonensis]|uniref:Alpha-ketoglutarate-dependent dioxygenase AlkB n=1 Tax=Brucella grignonensis TaxID=94627 RepID=A0A256FQI1_9HYPH|nr:DNA oxidative demethylase AlkB [Brucella grignonensis]NKB83982.1 DNA oxidative demethylase AlkB [Brucella grignonensis]OYR17122.1 2OG-Fe(II) oxygenase superfamily protein [Brucella grignonensis]